MTYFFGDFLIVPFEQNWFNIELLTISSPDLTIGFEITVGDSKISYLGQTFNKNELVAAGFSPDATFVFHEFNPDNLLKTLNNALIESKHSVFSITHWALNRVKFARLFEVFKPFGVYLLEATIDIPKTGPLGFIKREPKENKRDFNEIDPISRCSVDPLWTLNMLKGKDFQMIDFLCKSQFTMGNNMHQFNVKVPTTDIVNYQFRPDLLVEAGYDRQIFPTGLCYTHPFQPVIVEVLEYSGDGIWSVQIGTYHDKIASTSQTCFLYPINCQRGRYLLLSPTSGNLYVNCRGQNKSSLKLRFSSPSLTQNDITVNNIKKITQTTSDTDYVDFGSKILWTSVPRRLFNLETFNKIWPHWERAVEAAYKFKGLKVVRPVYVVFGLPQSGFFHSGYPIVGNERYISQYINGDLFVQLWPVIHEIGHNLDPSWLPKIFGEITNELYTTYALTSLCHDLTAHDQHSETNTCTISFVSDESKFLEHALKIISCKSREEKLSWFNKRVPGFRFSFEYGFSLFFILIKVFGWEKISQFAKQSAKWTHLVNELDPVEYFSLFAEILDCDIDKYLQLFGFKINNGGKFTRWLNVSISLNLTLDAKLTDKPMANK